MIFRPSSYSVARPNAVPVGLITAGIQAGTALAASGISAGQAAAGRKHQFALSEQELELANIQAQAQAAQAGAKADVQKMMIIYGVGTVTLLGLMGGGLFVWSRSRQR